MNSKNPYPGVNAHLNSALQQKGGGWKSFHAYHLIHLADALNEILPENYYAKPEDSLQISTYDRNMDSTRKIRSDADVLVTRQQKTTPAASVSTVQTPTMTLPLSTLLEEDDDLSGLVIYNSSTRTPVTRLEVLSPANKAPGSHHRDYALKRRAVLQNGLRFVEIDYLHERRPTISAIKSYRDKVTGAMPYHIIVMNPHIAPDDGQIQVFSFEVMDAIPQIPVPLENHAQVVLEMNAVYTRTFSQRPIYSDVEYDNLPVNFDKYTDADKQHIQKLMQQLNGE